MSTTRKVKFQVTQQHIDDGEPGNDSSCPVALCIKEWALEDAGEPLDVYVGDTAITIEGNCLPSPESVERFVNEFDEFGPGGDLVHPFEFELELP